MDALTLHKIRHAQADQEREQIIAAFEGAIIKDGGVKVATFIWCLN